MLQKLEREDTFAMYFQQWVTVYKVGAIREVTLSKYNMTQSWIERLAPDLKLCDLNRTSYQHIINQYAVHHERQTTMDFHHHLKGAILDAVDDGLIDSGLVQKIGHKVKTNMLKYLYN